MLATADGEFDGPKRFKGGTEPVALAVADLDRDGRPDLAAGNQQSADVSVLINST